MRWLAVITDAAHPEYIGTLVRAACPDIAPMEWYWTPCESGVRIMFRWLLDANDVTNALGCAQSPREWEWR